MRDNRGMDTRLLENEDPALAPPLRGGAGRVSGLTAFPLEWETRLLNRWAHEPRLGIAGHFPELAAWLARVHEGLRET